MKEEEKLVLGEISFIVSIRIMLIWIRAGLYRVKIT